MLELLLKNGANIWQKDADDWVALHFAALVGWLDTMRREQRVAVQEGQVTQQGPAGQVDANLTLRQRTELHRSNPVCANCHRILDPIGFGLENFDAIGRWRDRDESGGPIDAAGELPGGKSFDSPAELKALIASRQDDLARSLTEKFLAYALGRQLDGYDHIVVDQMLKTLLADDCRMQTLILETVTSYPFLNRRVRD